MLAYLHIYINKLDPNNDSTILREARSKQLYVNKIQLPLDETSTNKAGGQKLKQNNI